jgi:hypothetical protein
MKWRRPLLVGLCLIVALPALGLAWLVMDEQRAFIRVVAERVTGNTPERAAADYASALLSRDESLALARWSLPTNTSDALVARRATLTHQLLGTASHRVTNIEWWGTCCMPTIVTAEYAQYAGFARLSVDLDGVPYVFDILAAGHVSRFDDYGGPRTWLIRDVYPATEKPLFWTWPGR